MCGCGCVPKSADSSVSLQGVRLEGGNFGRCKASVSLFCVASYLFPTRFVNRPGKTTTHKSGGREKKRMERAKTKNRKQKRTHSEDLLRESFSLYQRAETLNSLRCKGIHIKGCYCNLYPLKTKGRRMCRGVHRWCCLQCRAAHGYLGALKVY